MVQYTNKFQVELKNDLLMIKDLNGNLLKAMTVPVINAVERMNEMVAKLKELETKKSK
jgi:hypothetical protein